MLKKLSYLKVGDRVSQAVLGQGTVESDETHTGSVYITFDNAEVGSLWRRTSKWYCPDCEPEGERSGFLVRPV